MELGLLFLFRFTAAQLTLKLHQEQAQVVWLETDHISQNSGQNELDILL